MTHGLTLRPGSAFIAVRQDDSGQQLGLIVRDGDTWAAYTAHDPGGNELHLLSRWSDPVSAERALRAWYWENPK